MTNHNDFPVLRGTFSIRSPRNVLLLAPFELWTAFALWVTAIVFTIWPEALEHAPVSFEQRGVVHHVWHYALLLGSTLLLTGLLWSGGRRLQIELVGLTLVIGCIGVNLTAVVADTIASPDPLVSGLGIGLRVGILAGMLTRALIIVFEPQVSLPTSNGNGE